MAGTAGFSGIVRAGTTATPTDNVGGCNSVSENIAKAILEVTEFGDTHIDRITGLLDSGCSIGGHANYSDTAQNAIRAAVISGVDIYVRILGDGTNGFEFRTKVASYSEQNAPDSTITFTAEFQGIAAPTTVP